jgi:hypothetical protein
VDPLEEVLPSVLAHRFDDETVLVGHSGGAALLLAILEPGHPFRPDPRHFETDTLDLVDRLIP